MYTKQRELIENSGRIVNWASGVKHVLSEIGLNYMWVNQDFIDINFDTIKQRIIDVYVQNWRSTVNESPKLQIFSKIKDDFTCSDYLNNILNKKLRGLLTKLRISAHDLNVERGRYVNIPREERLCNCCNMRVIENEYHFLLVCPSYIDIRRQYLSNYYCHWANLNK